ncbi:uncharacterized protein KY384_004516 [Bacidia gigantensis]|uniref:uncharacterized protein n=1 Tax=Bacidia gigantensis TaxID=2732470 RepID=UPI001D03C5D7|nr:uncharacterized protein KY384_004516 [Bacidia gigantensis]KAG8531158.1 hypothetical protein KY384_004516 [Bacidia gigantensis]
MSTGPSATSSTNPGASLNLPLTPTPRRTVRTRICIISDTHNALPPLPPSDILIHCGDISYTGRVSEFAPTIAHLASHPAPLKLVIAGNHDITLDKAYYAKRRGYMHGDVIEDVNTVEEMWKGEEARAKGIRYLEEGVTEWDVGNGAGLRGEDRYNADSTTGSGVSGAAENPVPDFGDSHKGGGGGRGTGVDIMITHGPPRGILDATFDKVPVGCKNLRRAVERAKPLVHCFGHIHEGWGIGRMRHSNGSFAREVARKDTSWWNKDREEKGYVYVDLTKGAEKEVKWGEQTMFVNAAIMDVRYRPVQKPWLLDVDLPVRDEEKTDEDEYGVIS